jgi:hypothetical protein
MLVSPSGFCNWPKTISVLLIGAAFVLQSAQTSHALTTYNLTVPITAPWYDTGIDVTAGTQLQISASGTVTFGPFFGQTTGPNGGDSFGGTTFDPLAIYPGTVVVSLIGKIGGTTAVGTGTLLPAGVPGNGSGFVGTSYDQVISNSGRLFLGFNDETGQFGDNSGSFSATVTVPEPSTAALSGLGALACAINFLKRKSSARKS